MKKRVMVVIMSLMFLVSFNPVDLAQAVDFVVSLTINPASGISVQADKRDGVTEAIIQADVAALNFDPMTLNTGTGVFEPNHFYTIDARTGNDGAGDPQVTVTYVEGAKPPNQTNGLGFKSTAAFTKVTLAGDGVTEIVTDLAGHGPKKLLKDISGELVTAVELAGGFLRLFVGVYLGDDAAIDIAGGEPFTAADRPGTYDGTLTLTGTVL